MLKTHTCGELTAAHIGTDVRLAGWVHRRRDHGGLIFLDLRDRFGLTQVIVDPSDQPQAHADATPVRGEWVLAIDGRVSRRPDGTLNDRIATGEIEVRAVRIEVLNESKTPPFYINEETEVDEAVRLRYRYLDLRRARMSRNLQLRHRVVKVIRDEMDERGFLEIETPILIKSTPEGARDYLVPSRIYPGHFYALPQSPQQLKQLLMVAGVERYFQIARCFRDEDLRADRQPEFTQLDVEMSFVDEEDIFALMEAVFVRVVQAATPEKRLATPFLRITHSEAMAKFGTDKPDLRFGLELADITEWARRTDLAVFIPSLEQGGTVKGFAAPGGASFTRREIDQLTSMARDRGARGLVTIALDGETGGSLESLTAEGVRSSIARHVSVDAIREVAIAVGARLGDLILIVAGPRPVVDGALSTLRLELGHRLGLADPNELVFAFITDFPLFEWHEEAGRWNSANHPFTAPRPEQLALLETDPGSVLSRAYDAVVNGFELASGSIRIHDRQTQNRIFQLLGYTDAETVERFGHLLEAFEYGAPPHGGFGCGIDRLVAILAGESNIREVMSFPKTQTAQDLMTSAPSLVDATQLSELHIRVAE